ncbi:hypothetical protein OAG58_01920 [Akkermansiaceae bacterium]|nr:hypothetical protein [Akkermansiaceae bacterium]MDB4429042.1 hypothetical protein [bacterium]MDA7509113.1 hypothetical protein [Akkermansiaceae bacterium]MDA7509550.1 hypothetical protein [Akkermansiaceae bacterium]MDA7659797.1 hypothetical protein [Akkermansiaceae bacterium]
MKKLVLLFGAFAIIGCGEKEKSTDTAEGGQEAVTVQEVKEEVDAVSSGPEPLISDADVERFAKDAFDIESASPPAEYTGWIKAYFDGAGTQLAELGQWKNGKSDGRLMVWYDTGEIMQMGIDKEGEMVLLQNFYRTGEKLGVVSFNDAGSREGVFWHKNGQKAAEGLIGEDGPEIRKFWNDEGEELDQEEGMKMMERLMD